MDTTQSTSLVDGFVKLTAQESTSIQAACDNSLATTGEAVSYESAGKSFLDVKIARARATWRKHCPPSYDMTNVSSIPTKKLNIVMPYQFGAKHAKNDGYDLGLYISGEPGTYKTRIAWYKCAMEFVSGKSFRFMSPDDFAMCSSQAMYRSDIGLSLMNEMKTVDLLFIDDLFKNKMTENQDFMLYAILETRMAWLKPFIITSNVPFDDIAAFFSDSAKARQVSAIMRRVGDTSKIVTFK